MTNFAKILPNATPVNRWTIQARAERLRGAEMRRMAAGFSRRIRNAVAGLATRRGAGQAA